MRERAKMSGGGALVRFGRFLQFQFREREGRQRASLSNRARDPARARVAPPPRRVPAAAPASAVAAISPSRAHPMGRTQSVDCRWSTPFLSAVAIAPGLAVLSAGARGERGERVSCLLFASVARRQFASPFAGASFGGFERARCGFRLIEDVGGIAREGWQCTSIMYLWRRGVRRRERELRRRPSPSPRHSALGRTAQSSSSSYLHLDQMKYAGGCMRFRSRATKMT